MLIATCELSTHPSIDRLAEARCSRSQVVQQPFQRMLNKNQDQSNVQTLHCFPPSRSATSDNTNNYDKND
uniref:Uncharacterized protein n=1 Tax=Panagrellus redivivus TaxID=6233 RepID=A0A7E4UNY9_PANRE